MAGQLIPKGEDYWLLRTYSGRDPLTKKRIYKASKFKGNQVQAQAELDRLVQLRANQANAKISGITVNEHFDQWFEQVAENRYAYKTLENYRGIIAYDVRTRIGHIKLSDLQPSHIQQIFSAMKARGVCSNTRRRLHSVIASALDCAVAWGTLERNPIARVEIPRREVKDMRAMSQEEVRSFLAVTDKGPHAEHIRTAVVTGMRPGEMAGLRWQDIDFKHGTIAVQRSLVWKGRQVDGWFLVAPKTDRGKREITIPESLVTALAEFRKQQGARIRLVGDHYQDHGFVFADEWGRPLHTKEFIRSVFKVALGRASLPGTIRLYDLRHTCATLLLKDGEHIKVVSERLGHSNVRITLEIYVHVLPGMQRDAAHRMENLLNPDRDLINDTLDVPTPSNESDE
jgi:integrase